MPCRFGARARLAVIVLLIGLVPGLGNARAAGVRTISSAEFGYSLSVPATWTSAPPGSGYDALLRSPDKATSFIAQVSGGVLGASGLRAVVTSLLHTLLILPAGGTPRTTFSTPVQPGGAALQGEARGLVSGKNRFAIARVVVYDGFTYLFYGLGPTVPAVTVDAPALALRAILASVTLHVVRAQFAAPSAYLGLYYPLGWKRVTYPDLGKIVLDGPGGAVIFADFGHTAANTLDLRFLLLTNASLIGKIGASSQTSFSATPLIVDNVPMQLVQLPLTDKLGRSLVGVIADASLNGFNYVIGGAAPKGSTALGQVLDTITSATMRPPTLPPDTGAFVSFTSAAHHYRLLRPAAWIAGEHDSSVDAGFVSRDGNLSMSALTRKGTVTGVLDSLVSNTTQGLTVARQSTQASTLGLLPATERVVQVDIVQNVVQETHIIAASSGGVVYVLTWNYYTNAPDAAALQRLAQRSQESFTLTS